MLIDIVVAIIVLISAGISFFRGLIRECLTILGVVGGLMAAVTFGGSLTPMFKGWFGVVEGEDVGKLFDLIPIDIVATFCAYAAIFLIVLIVISIISHFVSGAVRAMGLGPIDRTLGVIFGIVRAVVLMGLAYYPFHIYMDKGSKDKYFGESKTHYVIEKTSGVLAKFLPKPKDIENKVEEAADAAEGSIKKQLLDKEILYNEGRKLQQKKSDKENGVGYEEEQRQELDELMNRPVQ